jgi:hypothetical protein
MSELTFNEFNKYFLKDLLEDLSKYEQIDVQPQIKEVNVNGSKRTKVLLHHSKNERIVPTFTIEDVYAEYRKCEEWKLYEMSAYSQIVTNMCCTLASRYKKQGEVLEKYLNINNSNIKDKIYAKVINTEANEKFLETVPHVDKLNLSIVFKCRLEKHLSFIITNEMASKFNLSPEALFDISKQNAKKYNANYIRDSIQDVYCLSNKKSYDGAIAMFDTALLESISSKYGSDLVVIPSSTEEVIVFPDDGGRTYEDISKQILEVNSTDYVPVDVLLSNCVYKFDKESKELSIAYDPEVSITDIIEEKDDAVQNHILRLDIVNYDVEEKDILDMMEGNLEI